MSNELITLIHNVHRDVHDGLLKYKDATAPSSCQVCSIRCSVREDMTSFDILIASY